MDYRSNKILNSVLKKQTIDIPYLAQLFNVSDRMVRKLVKELNSDLQQTGLPTLKIDYKGILSFEKETEYLEEDIREFILNSNFYTYHLMPDERKTISAMILMNSEGYQTAAELSEYLEISRNTIISDLNELKGWFSLNKMTLSSQVQKGYKVKGEEQDIRSGILKLIELNPDYSNYKKGEVSDAFNHLLLKELQYEKRMPVIQKIVAEEEEHHDFYFSDFSFMEVVFELLIMMKRLSMGKKLNDIDDNIKKSSKYPLSKDILERVEEAFDISIPESEKKNFVQCLRRKSYLKSSTKNVDEIAVPIMIGEAIYKISERFNISFYLDFALYDVLVDHMKSAIYRTRVGNSLQNPFGNEIEKKYPEIFQVVEECVKPLENYIKNSFRREEISFLVMYFAAMLEKNRMDQTKERKVSVALVGAMGRGTMRLLKTEMEQFDDILEIVEIKSTHDLKEVDERKVGMIITTVPYYHQSIPSIQIQSPILKKEEIYEIRMTAMEILDNMQSQDLVSNSKKADLLLKKEGTSFLMKEGISLDVEVDSWEDAVRVSGEILYKMGVVEESYIEAMVDNIKQNGNYVVIYPELAIPHAEASHGALKEGVSFVRLKHPVMFSGEENAKVTYVVGLSILGSDSINNILYNLVKMFSNIDFKEKMDGAKTEKEMYELIKDKI